MTIIRHGDVSFIPCELPEGAKLKKVTSFVAALGEQTGHTHTLVAEPKKTFRVAEFSGTKYYVVDHPVTIEHQEHKTLVIPPGTYKQSQEREVDWFSQTTRQVID